MTTMMQPRPLCLLAWLLVASPALAAPTLPGGIIGDLQDLEQRLGQSAFDAVRERALGQAERLAGGNASDRWARALYLQLAASAEVRLEDPLAAADHLAEARGIRGVERAKADRWLRQEAGLRLQGDQPERAKALLGDWFQRHDGTREDHWLMAQLLAAESEWEAAARWVNRALEADATPGEARATLAATVLQRAGDESGALAVIERRLATANGDPEAWRRAAGLAQRLGEPGRAAAIWEAGWRRGVLAGSDDLRQRIRLHLAGGTPARAAELLTRALEEQALPDDLENRRLLARAWQAARDHEQALSAWRDVAERSGAGDDWLRLGELAYGWGEWGLAGEALAKAQALGELEAEAWLSNLPEQDGVEATDGTEDEAVNAGGKA
ncbi:tetratricopeptide repeat protein [Halomonas organivorans]|uniref:Tetratricopeptide repeat-like domain-containing protein n=1 Tax=Halomonas organivorans TaxID=257772 RepID=A0A7W5BVS9_9GAMM|nr:hypothetical protein [Halomonas organivorans]MBB3140026.1 hypothetical protein [Halomonas organivorans]